MTFRNPATTGADPRPRGGGLRGGQSGLSALNVALPLTLDRKGKLGLQAAEALPVLSDASSLTEVIQAYNLLLRVLKDSGVMEK